MCRTQRFISTVHALTPFFSQYPTTGERWDKVDDVTPDEDATYVRTTQKYTGYGHVWETYALTNPTGAGAINKITVFYRTKGIVEGGAGQYYQSGAVIYTQGAEYKEPDTGTRTNTTYQTFSYTWATNPATGNPWTWAEIAALEAGVTLAGAAWPGRCTQVFVEVEYIPFPTQYPGLRIARGGAVMELCLVAAGDGATGMGGIPRIRKGGTTYDVYLVETGDANASLVRIGTTTGIKAIRKKT